MDNSRVTLSVIAPCFNETGNLRELTERVLKVFEKSDINGELVLVDDGSTDGTGALIKELAQSHHKVRGVFHEQNKGMFAAWLSGVENTESTYICLIDADLQNLPEDVARLYREITYTHADMVQGVRSSVGRTKDSRLFLSRGLNALLNILFGMHARDNKSGFIIARSDVLRDALHLRKKYFYPQTLIRVSAESKGYSVREIETLFESRLAGESFITKNPIKPTLLSFIDLFQGFLEFRFHFKRDTILESFLSSHKPLKEDAPLSWWRQLLFDVFFFTLPLHAWMITGNTKKYYYELKKSQWLAPEDMKKLQEQKLSQLILHAYHHVPYYRDLFDAQGIRPENIRTVDDLAAIPLLDKKIVREHLYFDLMSDNHDKKKILKVTTSGSTGEPFVCYADQHQLEMRWAATLRSMEWTGYQFGDRQMRLWHQTLGMSWLQVFREKFDALLSRRVFIPAYEMSEKNISLFIKKLQKYKPALIDGYAESFNLLSSYIKQKDIRDLPSPKGIVSSAQVLPEQSRDIIESAFKTRVFDKYGSREFSGIAYESDAHDGHLVVAENYIVEILKDGKPAQPGEVGEVVITDLNNYCMPFIRYRIGDLAVAMDNKKTSPCGRGLPRIGKIEGRVQAIIVGANGNYLPGTFFAHLFKDYDHAIKQYKVIQEKQGAITLQIVKAQRFTGPVFDELKGQLQKFLGEGTDINVEFLDTIPMVRTGKQQGSVSRLEIDFQKLNAPMKNRT